MNTVGVTAYTNYAPPMDFGWKKCLSSTPVKIRKKMSNLLKNVGAVPSAHFQCMNNHYAKFEHQGIKTVRVTDFTNQAPSKPFG